MTRRSSWLALVAWCSLCGCDSGDRRNHEAKMPTPLLTLQLILHAERARYSVGEPIRPKLEIRNDGDAPADLGPGLVFDWERLAFVAPSAVRLVGPDAVDMAAPYREAVAGPGNDHPLRVEPHSSEWLSLPISAHVHLVRPGAYTFAIELADRAGGVHRSNTLGFELVGADPPRPGPARLELGLAHTAVAPGERVELTAQFYNLADRPMVFLRPQQDSFDGWVNPSYVFTVVDREGRTLARALRSGSMAEPRYNAATQLAISPGGAASLLLALPAFPAMRRPGEYRVRLTYLVRDHAIGKAGVVLPDRMAWSPDVFVGRLESADVVVSVR
jgi:hypothetical protein